MSADAGYLRGAFECMEKSFDRQDEDGLGSVTFSQFCHRLILQGFTRESDLKTLFDNYDVDGSGTLDFKEYLSLVYDWASIAPYDQMFVVDEARIIEPAFAFLRDAFSSCTIEESRVISKEQMRNFLGLYLEVPKNFDDLFARVAHAQNPGNLSVSRFLMFLYHMVYPEGRHFATGSSMAADEGSRDVHGTLLHEHKLMLQDVRGLPGGYGPQGTYGCNKCRRNHLKYSFHCSTCGDYDICAGCHGPYPGGDAILRKMFAAMEKDFLQWDAEALNSVPVETLYGGLSKRHRTSPADVDLMARLQYCLDVARVPENPSNALSFGHFVYMAYILVQRRAYTELIPKAHDARAVVKGMRLLGQIGGLPEDGVLMERDVVTESVLRLLGAPAIDAAESAIRRIGNAAGDLAPSAFTQLLYEVLLPTNFYFGMHPTTEEEARREPPPSPHAAGPATMVPAHPAPAPAPATRVPAPGHRAPPPYYEPAPAPAAPHERPHLRPQPPPGSPSVKHVVEELPDPPPRPDPRPRPPLPPLPSAPPPAAGGHHPAVPPRRRKDSGPAGADSGPATPATPESPVSAIRRLGVINVGDVQRIRKVGEGSFGVVYEAELSGMRVAAKFLTAVYSADTQKEFDSEVSLMNLVAHPNIVFIVGWATEPPDLCLVTEFCDRGSLFDVIHKKRQRFSAALVKRIAVGIAMGMGHLHSLRPPILHRDLKSQNVLLDELWTAKIADFGLSKTRLYSIQSNVQPIGTPQWMAPEVITSPEYGLKADVYAFGIILWELTHNALPYAKYNPMQIMYNVAQNNMRPAIAKGCNPVLARLMARCWDKDPARRPDFSECLEILERDV